MKHPEKNNSESEIDSDIMLTAAGAYKNIIDKTNLIDDLYWEIEKEGVNHYVIVSAMELIDSLQHDLCCLFKREEEIIYPELELVLPGQSFIAAIRDENRNILSLFGSITELLNKKDDLKKDKDLLQAEMISAADFIQRNVQKKESIIFRELMALLPGEKLDSILKKFSNRV
ncbi:MAG: hemerythrin domain-containing protein [Ignavibacteria bacterium]|nr:hemerythrin domain-containing protein [Ignavibacteria bacterium]